MNLDKLFFPDSILVLGVSDGQANLGKEVIKNLNRFGYGGRVYGLGRRDIEVEGRRVYQDIEQVPEVPDVAILLVPAAATVEALETVAAKGSGM